MDPYFGLTSGEIISGIQTSATNGTFGTNPVVDSVILSLKIDNIKGIISESKKNKGIKCLMLSDLRFLVM